MLLYNWQCGLLRPASLQTREQCIGLQCYGGHPPRGSRKFSAPLSSWDHCRTCGLSWAETWLCSACLHRESHSHVHNLGGRVRSQERERREGKIQGVRSFRFPSPVVVTWVPSLPHSPVPKVPVHFKLHHTDMGAPEKILSPHSLLGLLLSNAALKYAFKGVKLF